MWGTDLTKHECGSCRFYQEARDSKHGWCTHPERRESTAVRILVRSAELRCRNDWGADLWQERTDRDQVIDVVMHDAGPKSNPETGARPIPRPVDREPVVQPAMLIGDHPRVDEFERTSLVSKNLNRELLQRAHNQARERQKNRGYSVSPAEQGNEPGAPEREPLVISNQYVPPSRQMDLKDEVLTPFEFADHRGDGKFDERVLPAPSKDLASEWSFDDEQSVQKSPVPLTPIRASSDDELLVEIESQAKPIERPTANPQRDRWDGAPVSEQGRSIAPGTPSTRSASLRNDDRFDYGPATRHDELEPADAFEEFAAVDTWPDAEAHGSTNGVWSGIVRTCQTCRDFRPAGNGERGWCTNQWAFKHRRMVDAQDRPCETSIGHWWIPGDVVWQGPFDIAALGQPTPCVDKYLSPAAERLDNGQELPVRRRRQS